MTTSFYDSHLDTIVKLKALADKHGMKIRFGTTSSLKVDTDLSLLDGHIATEILNELDEHYYDIIDGEIIKTDESMWFELYDPQPKEKCGKFHTMVYEDIDISFRVRDDWQNELDNIKLEYQGDEDDDAIENIDRLIRFIDDNCQEWQVVNFGSRPTKIYGFGNDKEIIDGRVYRDGMALHFFTELVCEYLKEPMIHNTY